MKTGDFDQKIMQHAVSLAKQAGRNGNFPIAAVLCLDQQIIAEGLNGIWKPEKNLTKHAEMEAFRKIQPEQWSRASDMSLYSTLEPCIMCFGASILHGVGRVVFGASDPWAGASAIIDSLPSLLAEQFKNTEWTGPIMPRECGVLYEEAVALAQKHSEDPIHSHSVVDV